MFIPDPGSRVKKIPDPGSASKHASILTQNTTSTLSQKIYLGVHPESRIGFFPCRIPDPDLYAGKSNEMKKVCLLTVMRL
jgi:hypothetical protein